MAKTQNSKPRRRKLLIVILCVIAVLVMIRIALPYIVLHWANKTLSGMDGYYGHVNDIDLAIFRGAYKLCDFYLNKVDSATGDQSPFIDSRVIDLSVEWKALFHGALVGELVFISPHLKFVKEKTELKQVEKDTTDFRVLLKKFMPLKINRFEAQDGEIHYIDETSSPKVDIQTTNTHLVATNLRNSYDSSQLLPAGVRLHADVYEGTITINIKLNPLADHPTFDLNESLENTNLTKFNDFFKAYGNFDVHGGTFGLYSEVAAKDGKFTGYVKPVIKDLDVVGPEDRHDSFLQKLWEDIVGGTGQVFKNQSKDQVATKIPMQGDLSAPNYGIGAAVLEVLRNAFIRALFPAVDNQINIASVDKEKSKPSTLEELYKKTETPEEKKNKEKKKK